MALLEVPGTEAWARPVSEVARPMPLALQDPNLRWPWLRLSCHSPVPKSALGVMNFPEEETGILPSHGCLQKYSLLVCLLIILPETPEADGADMVGDPNVAGCGKPLGNPELLPPSVPCLRSVQPCGIWTACFSPSPPVPVGGQHGRHTGAGILPTCVVTHISFITL